MFNFIIIANLKHKIILEKINQKIYYKTNL
jgi:hypothetical protein